MIVPRGAGPDAQSMWLPPQEAGFIGEVTFGSGGLVPGRYDALLVTRGDRVLSRSTFWVVRRARSRRRRPAPDPRGRDARIAWRNAPADRFDWVGIWKRATPATSTTATSRSPTRARRSRARRGSRSAAGPTRRASTSCG